MNQAARQNSLQRERVWIKPEDLIVSQTDLDSIIIYANEGFCNISKYDECELLGQPQNIVRHPNMPKAIFELMWDHLNQEQEFFGYIINLAKDGSEYWTFAHATPIYKKDQVAGYISVRRRAKEQTVDYIEKLYEEMLTIEQNSSEEQAVIKSSARLWKEINQDYQSYAEFILSL